MEIKSSIDEFNSLLEKDVSEEVEELNIELLDPYYNHPFNLYEGDRLNALIESIQINGVINPIIVRRKENNRYEIIAGHNRVNGAKIVGLTTIKAIVRDLDDDEAETVMIETNLQQRSFNDLYPSEQAKILEVRYKNMKKQGIRSDLTDINNKYDSRGRLAEEFKLSSSSIQRLLKINKLCNEYKLDLDNKKISMQQALILSDFDKEKQEVIYDYAKTNSIKLNKNILEALNPEMDEDMIVEVLDTEKNDQAEKYINIKINFKYLPEKFKKMSTAKLKKELEKLIYPYLQRL